VILTLLASHFFDIIILHQLKALDSAGYEISVPELGAGFNKFSHDFSQITHPESS
jgi:hypothetical protein